MDWFRRHPLSGAVLLMLVAALALEGWLWSHHRRQSLRALAALAQKRQERDRLAQQSPAPDGDNEQAIARELAETRQVLATLRAALQGGAGGSPPPPPARGLDLYFDLATFVERTRALAARARVAVNPDERFGFASHASEGPEADLVPAVSRQGVSVQHLVEALIEARPRALLAVQREHPQTAAQRARRHQPVPADAIPAVSAGGQASDFFEFDPTLSVRVPGLVDSDAFRVEFTGQTTALRTFINALASFRLPVIVRRVEVEPLAAGVVHVDPAGPASPAVMPVPLVAGSLSKFAVVVEFVQLVPAPETLAP